jgi:hypothetical protein
MTSLSFRSFQSRTGYCAAFLLKATTKGYLRKCLRMPTGLGQPSDDSAGSYGLRGRGVDRRHNFSTCTI